MEQVHLDDRGIIEYGAALQAQRQLFDGLLAGRDCGGTLMLCEHPNVYTLGAHGKSANMLIDDRMLDKIGATFHRTDRGGDITFHGYGQMVAYPIFDIGRLGIGLRDYIYGLEEAVIATVAHWDIKGGRSEGATGVWCKSGGALSKICAIGVRASHFVTMHGLALNVNTDLKYFTYINPCGFTDRGVTSIEALTGGRVDMEQVKGRFVKEMERVFDIEIK
ncbi:MAG: lipoyl(octanoyl) transferase LipB [Rikenellaceae bacterium]|nr:lipoyl(octanoyl) transferase LipB [Rikenellaceae bacterium]